jgi:peptide/nickel transport system substrate-binding protein
MEGFITMRRRRQRRSILVAIAVVMLVTVTACTPSGSGSANASSSGSGSNTLVVGLTASDLPDLDTGMVLGQGYEGDAFVGNSLYDGLTRFDLNQGTTIPKLEPSLAASWTSDATGTTWTFKLRPGVKFTDGTPWDADAAVFNFGRYLDKSSPQYYPQLAATAAIASAGIKSVTKVDDMTIKIICDGPLSFLPSNLTTLYMGSPTAIKSEGNAGFAKKPVGTGPFIFASETRGQKLVMNPNKNYWGGAPKLNQLILRPMSDANARVAALRSGQVNWIEVAPPDNIPSLKSAGYQITSNSYDHIWPWIFDVAKKPWNNQLVRQAANYAINRESLVKNVLNGTADPAYQVLPRANAAYKASDNMYSYNPAKAKQLLTEAGYPHGFTTTLSYPTAGSGNMIPGPMNEALQQDLAAVGIKVTLQPIDWSSMVTNIVAGKIPGGADAINSSQTFQQDTYWITLFVSGYGVNLGHYNDPKVTALLDKVKSTVDSAKREALYAQAAKIVTSDAPWLFVVNDRDARAMASNVHGFVQPKSWFVDLTHVTVS